MSDLRKEHLERTLSSVTTHRRNFLLGLMAAALAAGSVEAAHSEIVSQDSPADSEQGQGKGKGDGKGKGKGDGKGKGKGDGKGKGKGKGKGDGKGKGKGKNPGAFESGI